MIERKPLRWFLAIAFGLAWILFALPFGFGAPDSQTRQVVRLVSWAAAMWAPGLGALLATRFGARKSLSSLNLRRLGPKRFYLWAWLLPISLAITTAGLTWAFGAGDLDREFSLIRQSLDRTPGGESFSPALFAAGQIFFAFTLAPLFNTLFALGEELGWRGFLLPRLLPMGQWKAILVSGAIWGVWHAPAILQGHNHPDHPVLGVFMMIVFTVLLGAILSWLYLETNSPWAPALAHGSLNASAGLPLLFLTDVDITLGGTIASLIGWIPLALCVIWLAWTRRLPVETGAGRQTTKAAPGTQVSRETPGPT